MARLTNLIGTLLEYKHLEFLGDVDRVSKRVKIGAIRTSFMTPVSVGVKMIVQFSGQYVNSVNPGITIENPKIRRQRFTAAFDRVRLAILNRVPATWKITQSSDHVLFVFQSEKSAMEAENIIYSLDNQAHIFFDSEKDNLEDSIDLSIPRRIQSVSDKNYLGKALVDEYQNIHLFIKAKGEWIEDSINGKRYERAAEGWQYAVIYPEDDDRVCTSFEDLPPHIRSSADIDRFISANFGLYSHLLRNWDSRNRARTNIVAEFNGKGNRDPKQMISEAEKLDKFFGISSRARTVDDSVSEDDEGLSPAQLKKLKDRKESEKDLGLIRRMKAQELDRASRVSASAGMLKDAEKQKISAVLEAQFLREDGVSEEEIRKRFPFLFEADERPERERVRNPVAQGSIGYKPAMLRRLEKLEKSKPLQESGPIQKTSSLDSMDHLIGKNRSHDPGMAAAIEDSETFIDSPGIGIRQIAAHKSEKKIVAAIATSEDKFAKK